MKVAGACPLVGAATCKVGAVGAVKCATNRQCNADTGAACGLGAANGVCWGLPTTCAGTDLAVEKGCNASGGGTGQCLSYCEAVRNEKPFFKDTANCN